ncbi:lipocalin family protein [Flavobacterium sp. SM2513]|uniref:lipocalin family protein n=1 Tax=Flavobacterium sp. SM2513 TaxID=3424766 RepID=UPI003D7F745C
MKKVVLMFVFAGLMSCSSDDSGNKISSDASIKGLWHQTDILSGGVSFPGYSCNKELDFAEFLDNGVQVTKYASEDSNDNCIQYTENGTYTLAGDLLTIKQMNGSVLIFERRANVKTLTSSKLDLEIIYEFESDGVDSYTSEYEAGAVVYTYEKAN